MSTISLATGRFGMTLKKNAPSIGIAGGVVGLCATVVLSSRATLKAQSVVAEHKELVSGTRDTFEKFEGQKDENGEYKYSQEDFQKDQVVIWSKTAVAMLKLYGPAFVVGAVSIAAIASSHKALNGRIAALSAAYQVAESALVRYRDKVEEELGTDIEKELFSKTKASSAKADEEAYEDEDRSTNTKKKLEQHGGSHDRIFAEGTSNAWRGNVSENMVFLRTQQNFFNDQLVKKGYVFLNEVYDALGFDRTPAGQIVGWVFTGDEGSNNFVDFGLDQGDKTTEAILKEIIDPSDIFLDFNVDGVMYDCI